MDVVEAAIGKGVGYLVSRGVALPRISEWFRAEDDSEPLLRPAAPVWLVVAYVVALLSLPSDVGIQTHLFVLTPSRILLGLLVCALLVRGELLAAFWALPRSLAIAWLLFLGSAAVTTLLYHPTSAVARFGSIVAEGGLVFVLVHYLTGRYRAAGTIQIAALATSVAVAGLTLTLTAAGYRYEEVARSLAGMAVEHSTDVRFGVARQEASFPAPLFFAAWLVAASVLALPWLESRRPWRTAIALLAWATLLLAAISTVSRVAIVLALVLAALYFLLRSRPWLVAGCLVLAVAAAVFMVDASQPSVVLPSPTSTSSGPSSSGSVPSGTGQVAPTASATPNASEIAAQQEAAAIAGSTAARFDAVRGAWIAFTRKPLFGWGLLTSVAVVSSAIGRGNAVDNSYLGFLVEQGAVGVVSFALLLLAVFARAARPPLGPRRTALGLALAALLCMSALVAFFGVTQGLAAFSLLAAVATAPSGRPHRGRDVSSAGIA